MPILKSLKQHKILLDTHVWIWLLGGNQKLKPSFRKYIEKCRERGNIYISSISIWEVGMLVEKGRVELEMDVLDWVEQAFNDSGIQLAQISPRIAIQSTRLPNSTHGDPADKILIATSHALNAVLVSADKILNKYGAGNFISIYNPC